MTHGVVTSVDFAPHKQDQRKARGGPTRLMGRGPSHVLDSSTCVKPCCVSSREHDKIFPFVFRLNAANR